MIMNSPHFGKMEYSDDTVVTFHQGIPGFEELRSFLIVHPDEELPFSYLQSVDQVELCFIVVNPFDFYPTYEFDVNETIQAELHIEKPEEVRVLSIVTVQDELEKATMNLLAPILINMEKRIGRQCILHHSEYSTKEALFAETVGVEVGEPGC